MIKKIISVLSFTMLSMYSFSQTVTTNIEKAAKDPKMSDNAAKADVYVVDKKVISNGAPSEQATTPVIAEKKKKKNACKRRCNKA